MVDLTQIDPVAHALESEQILCEKRPYLGMSSLGGICNREKWYTFRWAYDEYISPRMQRLFNRGHQEEAVMVADFNRIGIVCHDVLENQIEVVGVMGHLKGHPDGSLDNVPGAEKTRHNFEGKTANAKRFAEFKKFGCKETNLAYYTQSQLYMGYKGETRTLFCVTHKDTDERYYERIHFDNGYFLEMEDLALDILCAGMPPQKISEKAEWYECKWCAAYGICHMGETPKRNCRTCINVRIKDNGEFGCAVHTEALRTIPEDFQRTGCADDYRPCI